MITIRAASAVQDRHRQFWSPELPWPPSTAPRILIIEDDADCMEGWSVWLRGHGYETISARDGARGLSAIESEEPDLVLLDLGLPGMHGFKVLHELRMRDVHTRVVVATASSSPQTHARARALGADEVLAKPIDLHALIPVIEGLLRPG